MTGLAFGVLVLFGVALMRSSSGMFKFVPQNVHAMRTEPGSGSFGPPQAGQMMEVSVMFRCFLLCYFCAERRTERLLRSPQSKGG